MPSNASTESSASSHSRISAARRLRASVMPFLPISPLARRASAPNFRGSHVTGRLNMAIRRWRSSHAGDAWPGASPDDRHALRFVIRLSPGKRPWPACPRMFSTRCAAAPPRASTIELYAIGEDGRAPPVSRAVHQRRRTNRRPLDRGAPRRASGLSSSSFMSAIIFAARRADRRSALPRRDPDPLFHRRPRGPLSRAAAGKPWSYSTYRGS